MTDLHIRETDIYYTGDELQNIFDRVNSYGGKFAIVSGDVADIHETAAYTKYLALCSGLNNPIYTIAGNHDAPYDNYDASGLSRRFYAVHDGVAFIGVDTQEVYDPAGYGQISASELSWLETRLIEATTAGLSKIVFGHHPVLNTWPNQYITDGATELLALLSNYNVSAYLSGHRHASSAHKTVDGVVHVDGASTAYGVTPHAMMEFTRLNNYVYMYIIDLQTFEPINDDLLGIELR